MYYQNKTIIHLFIFYLNTMHLNEFFKLIPLSYNIKSIAIYSLLINEQTRVIHFFKYNVICINYVSI